jgi:hypothetical protein
MAAVTLGVTICAWFVPMLIESGGSDLYFAALNDLWSRVPSTGTVPAMIAKTGIAAGAMLGIVHLVMMAFFFLVCFTVASPTLLMKSLPLESWSSQKRFSFIWIIPAVLFFALMYMTYSNMGYMSVVFPPLFVVIGAKVAKWYEQINKGWEKKTALVTFLVVVNTMVFLYMPSYMGYLDTKNYENDILLRKAALNKIIDPENTLVVGMDAYRYGFREAGYYSPEYFVVQYPEMEFATGKKVFAMRNRKTILLEKIPVNNYPDFVILPIPEGKGGGDYNEKIFSMFPEGNVSKKMIDGRIFIHGHSRELKHIFPNTGGI